MAGTYEGWKNWDTWAINLALSNDYPTYKRVRSMWPSWMGDAEGFVRTIMPGDLPVGLVGYRKWVNVDWTEIEESLDAMTEDLK